MLTYLPFRRRFNLAALTAFVLVASSAFPQPPTDFSGTWRLRQPPSSGSTRVETIEQRGASLKIVIESRFSAGSMGGGFYIDHAYVVGGPAEVSRTEDGIIRTVSVTCEGAALVFLRTEQEGANISTTREVWSLSADGLVLTRKRHIDTWRGGTDEESAFDRQPSEGGRK